MTYGHELRLRAAYVGYLVGLYFILGGVLAEAGVRMVAAILLGVFTIASAYRVSKGSRIARYGLALLLVLLSIPVVTNLVRGWALLFQLVYVLVAFLGIWWIANVEFRASPL